MANILRKKKQEAKKAELKFSIDCSAPVEDNVIAIGHLENFLKQRIKVQGRKGNLGESVTLSKDTNRISVNSEVKFSKRYLKYLTKKYLKKQQLRDYLHVISTGKTSYELRYFNIHQDEESQ